MNKFKVSVIFDMDGTLADTAELTMAAFVNVLPGFGVPVPSLATVRAAVGYSCPEFYFRIFPDLAQEMALAIGDATEAEEERLLPTFPGDLLFPDVRALLTELRGRGVPMYIASTGSEDHVRSTLGKADITGMFARVLCGRPDKTDMIAEIIAGGAGLTVAGGDKSVLNDARANYNFVMVGDMQKDVDGAHANHSFIMVGDMQKDVDGAHANGIPCVGARYGYCTGGGFDAYIDAPGELHRVIAVNCTASLL